MRLSGGTAMPAGSAAWNASTRSFQHASGDTPQLAATTVAEIPPPQDPYE